MPSRGTSATSSDAALTEALEQLLAPIAHLCMARGLGFSSVQELLKQAFVSGARAEQAESTSARDISRVSAATGLSRREVTRITQDVTKRAAVRPSLATQVFARWMASKELHGKSGKPRRLKRQGPAPSFDTLASSVTRDVHPRTLLEELCRLGLAQYDAKDDTVNLIRDSFVPTQDQGRMFGFLGANVGDHMAAAVANVLGESSPSHPEQSIFADGLSTESLVTIRALVMTQWKRMVAEVVPELQALVDADANSGRLTDRRVRVGLYSYQAPIQAPGDEPGKKE
jgi:hypothetical protein